VNEGAGLKRTELQVLESLGRPSLLVLDEIGQRTESEWENRTFFKVLNARYYDMSDTILTCYLTLQELRQNLGPSLVDRMKEGGGMVECNWPSFSSPTS
jgi:DNA replication protein DnaC